MKKIYLKLLALLVGGIALTTANVGCSGDFVAGAVVGGVIGGVIGHYHGSHYHRHRYHGPHHHRHHYHSVTLQAEQPATELLSDNSHGFTGEFAKTFDLKETSVDYLLEVANAAEKGDVNRLKEIGLTQKELKKLGQLELPSDAALEKFAQVMETDVNNSRKIFTVFIQEAKKQFADVNSEVWKTCLSRGQWRTPQNLYCEKTWWSGCSPETGATMCSF